MYVYLYKQKTAYDMRISDGNSDVCASDLSSPSEKSVSPFSRSIEANGAGCQGVWTPRATQQAAPLRSPKAFHLGFLMQLGSTRTRLWNEAEQAGLIRVCTVSNSLEPGFRSLIFCNKSINDLGNWRRIDDGADAVTTAPDITPRLDAFRKVGLEKLEPIGKGIGIQASLHDRTAQECRR